MKNSNQPAEKPSYCLSDFIQGHKISSIYFPYLVDGSFEDILTKFNDFFGELQSKDYELIINTNVALSDKETAKTSCAFPSGLRLAYTKTDTGREYYMLYNNELVQTITLHSQLGSKPMLTLCTIDDKYMTIVISDEFMYSVGLLDAESNNYSELLHDIHIGRGHIDINNTIQPISFHPIITALLFMGIDYNDIHFNLKTR